MTAVSILAATKEMTALFKAYWDTTGHAVEWPSRKAIKQDADKVLARFGIQHEGRAQASLANVAGKSRRRATGFIMVEIFTPLGNGTDLAYQLAQGVINCYEGKRTASDVWFRDVRLEEQTPTHHERVNVIAEFEYDQIN